MTGVNIPHLQPASYACFIWCFLRKFSRNLENGSLIYDAPELDLRQRHLKVKYDGWEPTVID